MSETIKPKKTGKGILGWLKELLIFSLIVLLVGWGTDIWRSKSMVSGSAPSLLAQSVSGEQLNLITMSQDKPVMVYFWATWCAICSSVSPSVDLIADHYNVITIALTSGEPKRIQQYLNTKKYNFNVINDPKGKISREWGVSVTPTIFIVDKGEISAVTTGFTSPMGMWLRLLFA